MIERRPFSGRCQGQVANKRQRNYNGSRGDYQCLHITCLVQNDEWRCRIHIDFEAEGIEPAPTPEWVSA